MPVNDIESPDRAFAVDTNKVVLLDREGSANGLPLMAKYDVSCRLLDRVGQLLGPADSFSAVEVD